MMSHLISCWCQTSVLWADEAAHGAADAPESAHFLVPLSFSLLLDGAHLHHSWPVIFTLTHLECSSHARLSILLMNHLKTVQWTRKAKQDRELKVLQVLFFINILHPGSSWCQLLVHGVPVVSTVFWTPVWLHSRWLCYNVVGLV